MLVHHRGEGVVNTLINKLPLEAHLYGYHFCGPGTKLQKRLQRGDVGINQLDESCKLHDILYSQTGDLRKRHEADRILGERAWQRFRSKDAGFGEKLAALSIAGIMKAKTKLGAGVSFNGAVNRARRRIRGQRNLLIASKLALSTIKKAKIKHPKTRILPLPKRGGMIPLVPIFAALSALGSLGGGAASVVKAVSEARTAAKEFKEKERHNRAMEAKTIGKGLHLAPYKRGLGLYLAPYQPKNYQ